MTSTSADSERNPEHLNGRISVTRDGRRLDLVVDGISYSTFHPDRPWSGYVWDALAATALLVRSPRPRILMLGGGAGTVLVLLRRLLPDADLLAVELDPRVVVLARERFGLDALGAEILVADGLDYLARTRRRFDLIIDALYAPGPHGLTRPVPDEPSHLARVASRLASGGIAATNSTTDDDPPGLERDVRRAYRKVFAHRVSLAPRLGWNVVIAGSASPLEPAALARRSASLDEVDRFGVSAVRARRA